MAIKVVKNASLRWINIDKVDDEAISYLRKNFNFHHLDIEDLRGESQTPKIDTYKNYVFLVLRFPHWRAITKTVAPLEVDFFIGPDYVITVQHSKSKDMKSFFYKVLRNNNVKKNWMSLGPGFLLYKIIESLFHNTQPILNNMGRSIADTEQEIFDGELDPEVVKQLAKHRRNVLGFRRILDPQRYLISSLSHIRKPFLPDEMALYFDNVSDYLTKLWSILNSYRDTISGLHITVESLINQRTNKVIGALTVISVALLPLTLLAGIYGMNIPLPLAHSPIFVWLMFIGLSAVIIAFIVVMKKKRLL